MLPLRHCHYLFLDIEDVTTLLAAFRFTYYCHYAAGCCFEITPLYAYAIIASFPHYAIRFRWASLMTAAFAAEFRRWYGLFSWQMIFERLFAARLRADIFIAELLCCWYHYRYLYAYLRHIIYARDYAYAITLFVAAAFAILRWILKLMNTPLHIRRWIRQLITSAYRHIAADTLELTFSHISHRHVITPTLIITYLISLTLIEPLRALTRLLCFSSRYFFQPIFFIFSPLSREAVHSSARAGEYAQQRQRRAARAAKAHWCSCRQPPFIAAIDGLILGCHYATWATLTLATYLILSAIIELPRLRFIISYIDIYWLPLRQRHWLPPPLMISHCRLYIDAELFIRRFLPLVDMMMLMLSFWVS